MFTSLKLSKLLKEAGCDLESEWFKFYHKFDKRVYKTSHKEAWESEGYILYKSYDIANDILIRYAQSFFSDEMNYGDCTELQPDYEIHTQRILSMLQQGKDQDLIEDYIWDNCLFNNKNKGKDE